MDFDLIPRQIQATLDTTGETVNFTYLDGYEESSRAGHDKRVTYIHTTGETVNFTYLDEEEGYHHKRVTYIHTKNFNEKKVFQFPTWESTFEKEKTIAINAIRDYSISRYIDAKFTRNIRATWRMRAKARKEYTTDKDTQKFSLECPRCKCVLARIRPDSPTLLNPKDLVYLFRGMRKCIDCSGRPTCCFYLSNRIFPSHDDSSREYCLRCYYDKRKLVTTKGFFYFQKCDLEAFLDDYWGRCKPWLQERNMKKGTYKRAHRSYTLDYPSTFDDIKKMMFRVGKKYNKGKHEVTACSHGIIQRPRPLPTLQQLCVLKFVETNIKKEIIPKVFLKRLEEIIFDPDLKDDIELLYTFLHDRVLQKHVYVLTGGNANRPDSKFLEDESTLLWRHPIYKKY
jgi:hypothetical protein